MILNNKNFINKLKEMLQSERLDSRFCSHIIKISQNTPKPDKLKNIINTIAEFGITQSSNPQLFDKLKMIISIYAMEELDNLPEPDAFQATELAIKRFKDEASQYQQQLDYLNQNYTPPADSSPYSLPELVKNIPHHQTIQEKDINESIDVEEEITDDETLKIRDTYLPRLKEKIEKLQSIAEKIDAPIPNLNILSTDIITDEGTGVAEKWHTVKVSGEAPQINGWKLIAKLEHSPTGRNIAYAPKRNEDIPPEYYTISNNCEHCGYDRRRKNTYLLENINTGVIQQVGSTCLRDFTGHPNPEVAAAYFARLSEINPEKIQEENQKDAYSGEYKKYYFDPVEFLTHVAAMVRKQGWISKTQAMHSNWTQVATAYGALNNMFPTKEEYAVETTQSDRALAQEALNWIRSKDKSFYEKNDYLNNLWVVSQNEHPVSYQHTGILASLIPTYQKAKTEQTEQEKNKNELNFVGNEKERMPFTLTVNRIMEFPSNYGGLSYMHQMQDENGNIIIWWTTSDRLEEGETYRMDATIKEHKYYKGVPQTVITNPSKKVKI